MEKQLKCVLLLSLKEISLRRVAVLLWSGPDILASISKLTMHGIFEAEREKIRNKIKDKMFKLELPELLTNQMIELIRPMSLEVTAWKSMEEYRIIDISNSISLPDSAKLCWTTAGTINYRKTAEELLRCDKLDVEQRYRIACYYCLENRISLYWEELSEEKKDYYCIEKDPLWDLDSEEAPLWNLNYCWPRILKGKNSELEHWVRTYHRNLTSFNQFAFEEAVKGINKTAAEYFFQKLTDEERDASVMRTAHVVMTDCVNYENEVVSNRLLYLLSLMTPEQQMEIIKAHPIGIFLCFLGLRLQGLFRENVGLLWALLPPSKYIDLLEGIYLDHQIVYLPKMIKELFIDSPQDFKTCFVDETSSRFPKTPADRFLRAFFRYKDQESIEVIFRNVDAAMRVKLVRRNICLFYDYMLEGKWHLVELCLREATLFQEEKGRLKDYFAGFLEGRRASESPVFKRFFEFLDETDASSDQRKNDQKRKLENGSPES